ncbi:MAG: PAS domain-containing protein [Gammaproteobacteria bacterium]|nr:PAS domain-containing protein [Gammaproteobacteria bacterium]
MNSSVALGALHDLAMSPDTAGAALKLLHEMQVHQVELDLQEEELRRSVAELESALFRSVQLYDFAPAALFTIDRNTVLFELNGIGAHLLGFEKDAVLGRAFDSLLEPASAQALRDAMSKVVGGAGQASCTLRIPGHNGAAQVLAAAVSADPGGPRFLVACVGH